MLKLSGRYEGARSVIMAKINTGMARRLLNFKRRLISFRSEVSSSAVTVMASSTMPHLGNCRGDLESFQGASGRCIRLPMVGFLLRVLTSMPQTRAFKVLFCLDIFKSSRVCY